MPATRKQIEAAAEAIHHFELRYGFITREWNGARAEPVYCGMAKAALDAAERVPSITGTMETNG